MRIYSKFSDYYDSVGYYSEEDRVWSRKTRELNITLDPNYPLLDAKNNAKLSPKSESILRAAFNERPTIVTPQRVRYGWQDDVDYTILVGFCGKLYLCAVHSRREDAMYSSANIYNTYADFNEYMTARSSDTDERENIRSEGWVMSKNMPFTEKGFSDWNKQHSAHPDLVNVFVELHTPVFIIKGSDRGTVRDSNFVVNPCMKDYKLQNVFHPYVAHQEVDMFLGNELVMCTLKDFEMSDELMRDSKGMDEWSFKQRGPKARKRK